jgi:hypothetical protein
VTSGQSRAFLHDPENLIEVNVEEQVLDPVKQVSHDVSTEPVGLQLGFEPATPALDPVAVHPSASTVATARSAPRRRARSLRFTKLVEDATEAVA